MSRKDPQRESGRRSQMPPKCHPNASPNASPQPVSSGGHRCLQEALARQHRGYTGYFSTSVSVHAEGWLQVGFRYLLIFIF